ncbi:MAG: HesA/MoeB/ThiF family protein [Conexivisphaerales archaeon]|nr:HesA/MoeB/ThiF family protein [Conexivisphaerales archaeon]
MIDDRFLNRYSRQIVLKEIGFEGQEKLLKSRVTVVGVGGLGSMVASLLARMGFGEIHIIDRDIVSLSDLHRQILYDEDDLGLPKVYAAQRKLQKINSDVKVFPHAMSANNYELMKDVIDRTDVIVDGLDNMRARFNVNLLAVTLKRPYVFASAIENYGNLSTVIPGKTPCLNEFYGEFRDRELPTCATSGVNPAIVTSVASLEVNEALKMIVEGSSLFSGKLALLDLNQGSLEAIDLKKDEECEVCNMRAKPEKEPVIEISCSKDGFSTVFVNNYAGNIDTENISQVHGVKITAKNDLYVSGAYEDSSFTVFNNGYAVFQFKYYDDQIKNRVERIYGELVGRFNNKQAF